MTLIRHIYSPQQLTELVPSPPSTKTTPQTIEIHLLEPLAASPETLAWSKTNCLELEFSRKQQDKYLNLSDLSKCWRAAWSQIPPATTTTAERFIFDICLPHAVRDL